MKTAGVISKTGEVRARESLPTYLTQQQVRDLFAKISNLRDRAMFPTAYLYGLRVSEICLLDREDLDLQRDAIRILRSKGGVPGEKPLFRSLKPLLVTYLTSRKDGHPPLFVGRQGRLSRRRVQELFKNYSALAGIPASRSHVHSLRHSIATHMLDAGEPIDFVQDHLGHRSIESTLVYARISDGRRMRTIRRLERSSAISTPA